MVKRKGISLQPRDKKILELLRDQGVASSTQLESLFFPSRTVCAHRLSQLCAHGYLSRQTVEYLFPRQFAPHGGKKYFPYLMGMGISPNSAIYRLGNEYLGQVAHTKKLLKPNILIHQLLLGDVKRVVESHLQATFVHNDPKLTILADIQFDRLREFTPDLSLESSRYRIAVELERTQKSLNRYVTRFYHYKQSAYTHVLYFYVNENHLKSLLRAAGNARKFAFAHYLKPNELLSNTWGYLTLSEFVERVNQIQKGSNQNA